MGCVVAIELGGTEARAAIGYPDGRIVAMQRLSVRAANPAALFEAIESWVRSQLQVLQLAASAIGISSFGPVDLDANSPHFGHITKTPKEGWSYVDVVGFFRSRFGLPVRITHDVLGAALGERAFGAAKGLTDFLYITLGTGIGVGPYVNGQPLHGLIHCEGGHMLGLAVDGAPGVCKYHGSCWEGLCSGPGMEKFFGQRAEQGRCRSSGLGSFCGD